MLNAKNIVLGVSGGIAAYKAAELVSSLKKKGADVSVVMTKNATEFISPLTLKTLSQNPVSVNMFDNNFTYEIGHISLADKADVFVVAPATANVIGKIAAGIADDMLSTSIMAANCPKVIAPAMNTNMYNNPIVQENIEKLKKMGYIFVSPRVSRLACGTTGVGALADILDIESTIEYALSEHDLEGKKVLVTAGPTREEIDPVRFITNHSSGKMGYAVAKNAYLRGADVTLISGHTEIKPPFGVKTQFVSSADDMYEAVMDEQKNADIIVKAAAVADFKPKRENDKIKKDGKSELNISLTENKDILKELGKVKGDKILIGFCMETKDLLLNAEQKLKNKNLDFIVANSLNDKDAGFGTDTNTVTLLFRDGKKVSLPNMSKDKVAEKILNYAIGTEE